MRAATGESEPDLEQIRELEERLDNFRIQVADDMTIRGSAWQGYALNSKTCGEMGLGGTPTPPNPGACCLPDGTCETVTPGQCLLDGGTFSGGPCDPNPCSPALCLGACCNGTGCGLDTEEDCVRNGGTFHGCGTECHPNPCGGGDECFDLGGTPCGPFCCFSPNFCLDPFRGCCPSTFYPCYGSVINHCCCGGDPSCSDFGPDVCCGDGSCCPGGTTCCPEGCILGGFCCSEFNPCTG